MFFASGEVRLLERTCSGPKAAVGPSHCKHCSSKSKWGNQRQCSTSLSVFYFRSCITWSVVYFDASRPWGGTAFCGLGQGRQDWDLRFQFLPDRHQVPCLLFLSVLCPVTFWACLRLGFGKTKNSVGQVGLKHLKASVVPSCTFKPSPADGLDVNTEVAPKHWSTQSWLPLRPGAMELFTAPTISSHGVPAVNGGAEHAGPQTKPNGRHWHQRAAQPVVSPIRENLLSGT